MCSLAGVQLGGEKIEVLDIFQYVYTISSDRSIQIQTAALFFSFEKVFVSAA